MNTSKQVKIRQEVYERLTQSEGNSYSEKISNLLGNQKVNQIDYEHLINEIVERLHKKLRQG